jgi:hypothetical protein
MVCRGNHILDKRLQGLPLQGVVLVLFTLSWHGCSWVTRDYVYVPAEETGWRLQLRKGEQKNVKEGPTPDTALLTFDDSALSMQLSAGYTLLRTVGPLWFPVVPSSSGPHTKEPFRLTLVLDTKREAVTVDATRWEVSVNGQASLQPFTYQLHILDSGEMYTTPAQPQESSPVTLRAHARAEVLLTFPIPATTVSQVHLQFKEITSESHPISVPPLYLRKREGSWNYDEFTL